MIFAVLRYLLLSTGLAAITITANLPADVASAAAEAGSFAEVIAAVQPRIVKIYGSGGLRGLEAYQSGFLISADGHILTAWSYVLDAEEFINVVLNDGTRFEAKLVGHDPRLEIAILKIDATGLPHFNLDEAVPLQPGAGCSRSAICLVSRWGLNQPACCTEMWRQSANWRRDVVRSRRSITDRFILWTR